MKLFSTDNIQEKIAEKAAASIANGIIRLQDWFAAKMQGLTKKWEQRHRWLFLYLLCLVFGGLSIAAIIGAFQTNGIGKAIIPTPIRVTKITQWQSKGFLITKKELQLVQRYKAAHPALVKEMPVLYDSLSLIEQMYYSQQK